MHVVDNEIEGWEGKTLPKRSKEIEGGREKNGKLARKNIAHGRQ